ncbi:MAG: beta-ketoacyl synthase N-terminal-like domain-containing protein [Cellvibrionaceae bacterium]
MKPVYIIGTGLHTALGSTTDECITALHQIGDEKVPSVNASTLSCTLPNNEITIPYYLLRKTSPRDVYVRLNDVLFDVISQAIEEAGLSEQALNNIGLFVGSSSFEIADEEERFRQSLSDADAFPLAECGMGNLSERIRKRFDINGPDFTFNTACTSSANAMLYAGQLIDQGVIENALVVAVEFSNDTTTYGFYGLQLLSQNALLPFDDRRDGLILGESCAAAILCGTDLSSGDRADKNPKSEILSEKNRQEKNSLRKSNAMIRLLGGANLCDTHSMSITHEDGDVVAKVIASALKNASVSPEEISAIKCHGTATMGGDAAEANGMRRALESVETFPQCCAIKPFIGHTLGACGLSEFILFCGAAQRGFIPATKGIAAKGNDLGIILNQGLNLQSEAFEKVNEPIFGKYLLNYFGFGGNNTSLVADIVDGGDHG